MQHDRDGVHTPVLQMGPGVLLEMVLPPEPLAALVARERSEAAVNSFMACQLLVPCECFAAVLLVAAKRSFT